MIYLDTHVVSWLYAGRIDLFTPMVLESIEENALLISPIVSLELEYLFEIKRIKVDSKSILEYLKSQIGVSICDLAFDTVIEKSLKMNWTRDPFDRIIVAQASIRKTPLITKDRLIHNNYENVIW